MIFVIIVCVNIALSPWIGHRGSPTSTLDNITTTFTDLKLNPILKP